MSADRRKYVVFGVLAVITAVLDQWSKIWARATLGPSEFAGKVIRVLDDTIFFRYAENPGVAFSMFRDLPGRRVILTLVAAGALVLVLYYLYKTEAEHKRLQVALGLIGGGALGNMIDRALYGVVTDFVWVDLNFRPFDPWPAFNVADAALVIGVGLMALDMFRPLPKRDGTPNEGGTDKGAADA